MPDLPSGTVTFLFTDIEGSTTLWERDRSAMQTAVERHLALLRAAIEAHGGVLFKVVGDAVQAAFPTAPSAVDAAVSAQRALLTEPWGNPPGPLRVRMALHTGEASPWEGDYLAAPLNRLARLLVAGHGGQVVLTQAVQQLVREDLPAEVALRELGTHRFRDLQQPEEVFQVLAAGLPETFPPLRSLPRHPTNLLTPPTSLIGREAEVSAVLRLHEEGTRCVTLTGPGGSGKTRLAVEVASEMVEHMPDGVWFVDLAPVRNPGYVVPTMAGVVGVREHPGEPVAETLRRSLVDRTMLIVLDNCEQVLDAAPAIANLLAGCPHLRILATSREPLHLRGERIVAVDPLPLPDVHQALDLATLAQIPAITLFIERAQAADPAFTLTEGNAAAVAAICRRLDGLPLAIELAAARVRLLPPPALLGRLERRLPVLTSGARDAPARQRTLRDAIAWSYDLLPTHDQVLLRRLGVFVGGWTLEAAEAIANPDGDLDILDGLGSLVERSLVRRMDAGREELRFVMLETIREFSLERLVQAGEDERVCCQHTEYFASVAETAGAGFFGPEELLWLDRCEAESANLSAAMTWSATHDPEPGLRMAGSLWWFWHTRAGLSLGRRAVEQVLARRDAVPSRLVAKAVQTLGLLATFQPDHATARRAFTESLGLFDALGDEPESTLTTFFRGMLEQQSVGSEAGDQLMREALAGFRRLGDRVWEGITLYFLGTSAAFVRPDLLQAEALYREALAVLRQVGYQSGVAMAMGDLGEVLLGQGRLAEAEATIRESLALRFALRDRYGSPEQVRSLARVAAVQGNLERATRLWSAGDRLRRDLGADVTPTFREEHQRFVHSLKQGLGDEPFRHAWEAGQGLSLAQAVDEALKPADKVHRDYA